MQYSLPFPDRGVLVPKDSSRKKDVLLFGRGIIQMALSRDGEDWTLSEGPVLAPRPGFFDQGELEVGSAWSIDEGLLILYHSKNIEGRKTNYCVGLAILDKDNLKKVVWRSSHPIWVTTSTPWQEGLPMSPVGAVLFGGRIVGYWNVEGEGLQAVTYPLAGLPLELFKNESLKMVRPPGNPLIYPQAQNAWEAFTTFNPAAVRAGGKVHLFYRAQGYDYVSNIGYATTSDGVTIDERLDKPVFTAQEALAPAVLQPNAEFAVRFMSGGGLGGCEDPRVTLIDNRVYMTYVAYDGASEPRVRLRISPWKIC